MCRVLRAPWGSVSKCRKWSRRKGEGIKVAQWRYDHGAVVTVIDHAKPHGNTAHEMFYQTGPFAILPMNGPDGSGTRSAIVWTVARDLAPAVPVLPARALAAEIEKRMGGLLGAVRLADPAWSRAVEPQTVLHYLL